MSDVITPEQIREEAAVRAAFADMSRSELESAAVHMIGITEAAAVRVHALEVDLQLTRDLLERERRLNASIKRRKKGRVRRVRDEQWFELVSAFDPKKITKIPIPGNVFILGHVDDLLVVELPQDATQTTIDSFRDWLRGTGVTSVAICVSAGTRFLKLHPCDAAQVAALNSHMAKLEHAPEAKAQAARSSEDGPEADPAARPDAIS